MKRKGSFLHTFPTHPIKALSECPNPTRAHSSYSDSYFATLSYFCLGHASLSSFGISPPPPQKKPCFLSLCSSPKCQIPLCFNQFTSFQLVRLRSAVTSAGRVSWTRRVGKVPLFYASGKRHKRLSLWFPCGKFTSYSLTSCHPIIIISACALCYPRPVYFFRTPGSSRV